MNSKSSLRFVGLVTVVLFILAAGYAVQPGFSLGLGLAEATGSKQNISLDARNAELRDVLSALAVKMDVGIILTGEPTKVDFRVDSVPPMRALELLLQTQKLDYIQDQNLIIVGNPENLKKEFFNRLILTRFDLLFVPAAKVQTAAGQLGIPLQSLAPDPATNSVWAQGTPLELRKLQELIHVLDRPVHDLSLDYRTLHLTTISPERARQILTEAGIKANYTLALKNRLLVFDTDTFARWAQVEALIKAVDNLDGREDAIFAYQLKNISAQDAEERLGALPLPVTTVTFNYPDLTQEILVICPSHLESQVRSALSSIDSTRKKIRVPVHNSTIHEELNATRSLLSELSGVSVGNMHISRNLSGDSDAPYYVLWVEETPERIAQIEVLIEKLK